MADVMLPISRWMSIILTLSMYVCGALCFGVPAEFKRDLPIQTAVLNLEEDGRTACNSGGEAGVCYDPLNCYRLSGVFAMDFGNTNCPEKKGICCLFHRQCGQRSSQEVSYFESAVQAKSSGCNYRVVKRSSIHCGMRIKLEQLELPIDCQTSIYVEGIHKGNSIGKLQFPERESVDFICSTEAGKEYAFDTRNIDEVHLNVESFDGSSNSGSWKIKVTQEQCRDDEQVDVAHTESSHISAVWPTTPESTVYSSYSTCGKKGPNYRTLNLRTIKNTSDGESKHFIEDTERGNHSHKDSEFFEILRKLEEQISKDKFTTSNVHGRITFGQIAGSHEYPWQVGIKIRGKIACGASIISDQHILTAAHCVEDYQRKPHHLYMYFGNYNLDTSSYERNVERVIIHPSYTRKTSGNDIAVLKLKSKITFSDYIRPVCLAPPGLDTNYKTAIVTGWGLDENKQTQTRLNELEAKVISNSDCGQQWENKGAKRGLIKSNMMCLSPIVGDSCDGDSGGPSVMEVNDIYYQVGIVSFGSESCTDKSLPGVYTRVSSYQKWILQQMN